jgi:hypothetical protein
VSSATAFAPQSRGGQRRSRLGHRSRMTRRRRRATSWQWRWRCGGRCPAGGSPCGRCRPPGADRETHCHADERALGLSPTRPVQNRAMVHEPRRWQSPGGAVFPVLGIALKGSSTLHAYEPTWASLLATQPDHTHHHESSAEADRLQRIQAQRAVISEGNLAPLDRTNQLRI